MKKYVFVSLIACCGLAGALFAQEAILRASSAQKTSSTPGSSAVAASNVTSRDQYTVIGFLEKRDRVITIKSGPRGPVYSVATKDGKVLHENLSAENLKAQAPEIHDLIKTGMAADLRGQRPAKDASLGLSR
jgi:hypothetical protein